MTSKPRFSFARLAWRGLVHHRRAHLASLLAVATATAIITGALVVGDSVRGSLRDRVLERLGRIEHVLMGSGWFRERLAEELAGEEALSGEQARLVPGIVLRGSVVSADPEAELRSGRVNIYGVPPEFWSMWDASEVTTAFAAVSGERIAWLNDRLARAVAVSQSEDVLVYVQKGEEVAAEHLLGSRTDRVRPLRLTVDRVIPDAGPGLFRLDQGQQVVHNLYVPLPLLQRSLEKESFVNALFVAVTTEGGRAETEWLTEALQRVWSLEDAGLRLVVPEAGRYASLESRELLLTDPVLDAARGAVRQLGAQSLESLTYLANSMASLSAGGEKEIPYSTVTAVGAWRSGSGEQVEPGLPTQPPGAISSGGGIVLNDWATKDLEVAVGNQIRLRYFVVGRDNELEEVEATFELRAIVPLVGEAADPGWTPTFPGISDADSLQNWDPPFEIDLNRIRDRDEEYWDAHRTTPKAFVSLADGRRLWSSRFGEATSLRVRPGQEGQKIAEFAREFTRALLGTLEPESVGLVWRAVKAEGLEAAAGATDFSMLFVSFSFFLIVSALVLLALVYRLSCELRFTELGTLLSLGYGVRDVRALLVREGWGLVVGGAVLGAVGGLAYAALLIEGLRTLWRHAVNAPFLAVHPTATSLLVGVLTTGVLAFVTIYFVARRTARTPPRTLLVGPGARMAGGRRSGASTLWRTGLCVGTAAIGALLAGLGTFVEGAPPEGLFFGAGACGLVAGLAGFSILMERPPVRSFRARGWLSVFLLGLRNTGRLPRRSLLTATVLACASFLVVAVAAQRRDARVDLPEKTSGNGGFALAARSAVPLTQSLSTVEGRDELALRPTTVKLLEEATVVPFRVRPGDDASCLNLYRPKSPRILGAPVEFLRRGGFAWASSLAESEAERANPWLLLEKSLSDGAVPAVGDLNTVMWILHSGLGKDLELVDDNGKTLTVRLVGLLSHSIFQGELITSEGAFLERFPGRTGRSFFLVEGEDEIMPALTGALEKDLQDYGFDVQTTGELLAAYKQVENTYLSTFQILGALGLLLGTFGLGVVLYRNVNERRGELAVLRAVGFSRGALSWLIFSETAVLLSVGLLVGGGTALLAVIPQLSSSGTEVSFEALAVTLLVILVSGLAAALVSLRAALKAPLLPALRSE